MFHLQKHAAPKENSQYKLILKQYLNILWLNFSKKYPYSKKPRLLSNELSSNKEQAKDPLYYFLLLCTPFHSYLSLKELYHTK